MYATHMHKELYSGVLHKCGGKRKTWNKRYMILRNDYCLYYYKDTAKGHLGVVSLRDPHLKVRQGEWSDCRWPKSLSSIECSLVIITSPRTYFMYAECSEEAEEWRRVLQTAHDLLRENAFKANKLVTRSSLTSISSADCTSDSSGGSSPKEESKNGSPSKSNGTTVAAGPVTLTEPSRDGNIVTSTESEGSSVSQTATNDALIPGVEAIYDLAHAEETPTQVISEDACTESYEPMNSVKHQQSDEPLQLYEPVDNFTLDVPLSTSVKNQPLPPIPIVKQGSSQIYDDIVDKTQPLYEAVEDPESSSRFGEHRHCVAEANDSGDEEVRSPLPPLPPKDTDVPPLPPKDTDILPPLPPKNDTPVSPKATNLPPLPPKENGEVTPLLQKEGETRPSHLLGDKKCPPSPRKSSPSPRLPRDPAKIGKELPTSPRHTPALCVSPPQPQAPPERERLELRPAFTSSLAASSDQQWQTDSLYDVVQEEGVIAARNQDTRAAEASAKTGYLPPLPPKSPPRERKADTGLANGSAEQWDSEAVYDEVEFDEYERTQGQPQRGRLSSGEGRGIALFNKRKDYLARHSEQDTKKRAESVQMLQEVTRDPVLSPKEKTLFAETLREVEQERLLASEERFRWERERLKLEEDRKQFEEEKRILQEELEKTKYQLQNP